MRYFICPGILHHAKDFVLSDQYYSNLLVEQILAINFVCGFRNVGVNTTYHDIPFVGYHRFDKHHAYTTLSEILMRHTLNIVGYTDNVWDIPRKHHATDRTLPGTSI